MPTEQNVASDDAITDIRFPIRLLSLVCLLTIIGFAGLGWHVFDARRDAKMFADRVSRIEKLRGVIVYLDEVLTMSARMVTTTGDSRWEERYRHFEPQLEAAIKETTKIETGSPDIKAVTKTDQANTKLVEMENRAFALVRANRKEEARALLFSSEYEAQKKIYAEGITSFSDQIRREFDESLRADQRIDLFSMIAAMVIGGSSFVAWLSAARSVRRWRAQLLESFHRRAEAEQNLHKAHVELEVRVKKRTAELASANEALQSENAERKQAEDALRASEERYRSLFESNPNPMWVYDVETLSFLAVNATAIEHYGYSRDEFLAMTLKDIRPAEDVPALMDDLSKAKGDAKDDSHWRHCRKDRTMIYVEIASQDLIWLGRPARLVLINDTTERKQAEDRLRQQARLLDLAQDAIMVRDMEDRVEFWNHGAEELYGWTAAEVEGRKAAAFLYQDQPAYIAAARADVIETGKWAGECKHNCKDGSTITVRGRWTLVRDELAVPRSILIINTDVTEQRKLETHLLRAQRLESIGTLASGVAHDLNNILTPILMCTEVLKKNPAPADLAPLISMIQESATRGANVVKQVLTFARGIEGERVVIKPGHLIQEMIEIAEKTFPKTIEILSRYPNDLWSIKGDPTQLHQVLLNLSVNARDAMPHGGTLTFAAENFNVDENYASMMPGAKPGPHVMLRITDTGHGMPRAMIDKIFDPFFTTKEVGKGTGLGLSTTLGIVKSHDGFISVYSEPAKGTTFKLFLPATIQEEIPKSKTSIAPIKGNGELILVVDDEPNILGVTKMILEKNSYDVVSASDGPEALAIFAQRMAAISLVLTDLSMPYMDGIALVRSLKKMRPDLSIVASTGQGEQASTAELKLLGVKNFLTKPYNTERLLATLDDTLHGRGSGPPPVPTNQGS